MGGYRARIWSRFGDYEMWATPVVGRQEAHKAGAFFAMQSYVDGVEIVDVATGAVVDYFNEERSANRESAAQTGGGDE